MKRIYLTVQPDHVLAEYGHAHRSPTRTQAIRTYSQFLQFLDDCNCGLVLCSSSLDHPQDVSKSRKVINLCRKIRNDATARAEIRQWEGEQSE